VVAECVLRELDCVREIDFGPSRWRLWMILRLLHRIAAQGPVYDCIQRVLSAKEVYLRVARQAPNAPPDSYVLDLGGGTGTIRQYWPSMCRYLCLDIERPKLAGFLRKVPDGLAVQGDAARLPLANESIDTVVCTVVAHHLSGELLNRAVDECWRVLKLGGVFLFADGLRRPDRWFSRFMWWLDRGDHPHDLEELQRVLSSGFASIHQERFTLCHEYLIVSLRKTAARIPQKDTGPG
jgi:SAM-dependent methyltransferase